MMTMLNGRRVLLIATGAFLFMLVPNVLLAVLAVNTFSGLVTPNSYVASQQFDRLRTAQIALGWHAELSYRDAVLRVDFTDGEGRIVRPASLVVTLGRPTTMRDDEKLALVDTDTGMAAEAPLSAGMWRIEIDAVAADGTAFHQSRDLLVP